MEFHETGTLVAALAGDGDVVEARVDDMTPTERRSLVVACQLILAQASLYCDGCGNKIDEDGPFAALVDGTWHPECARRQRTQPTDQEAGR